MEKYVISATIVLTFDAETTIVTDNQIFRQKFTIFLFREVAIVVALLQLFNVLDLFAQFLILEVHFNYSM